MDFISAYVNSLKRSVPYPTVPDLILLNLILSNLLESQAGMDFISAYVNSLKRSVPYPTVPDLILLNLILSNLLESQAGMDFISAYVNSLKRSDRVSAEQVYHLLAHSRPGS